MAIKERLKSSWTVTAKVIEDAFLDGEELGQCMRKKIEMFHKFRDRRRVNPKDRYRRPSRLVPATAQ